MSRSRDGRRVADAISRSSRLEVVLGAHARDLRVDLLLELAELSAHAVLAGAHGGELLARCSDAVLAVVEVLEVAVEEWALAHRLERLHILPQARLVVEHGLHIRLECACLRAEAGQRLVQLDGLLRLGEEGRHERQVLALPPPHERAVEPRAQACERRERCKELLAPHERAQLVRIRLGEHARVDEARALVLEEGGHRAQSFDPLRVPRLLAHGVRAFAHRLELKAEAAEGGRGLDAALGRHDRKAAVPRIRGVVNE
mmetsp:Transcript_852/g.2244  ORF Transcript_852/g.2244 Transcript_852/m.2244 type:complete len:258 (-) Transcript_852:581-1354(-)